MRAGAIIGEADDITLEKITKYAKNIGLSFQIIDDILDELEIDTNFVFVKLRGKNKGQPLEYQDVSDLFKRLKKKTLLDKRRRIIAY